MARFHFVASTGRTATTFIAAALDQIEGVLGCHESYASGRKDEPVLPLINLEYAQCCHDPEAARRTVAAKRSQGIIAAACEDAGAEVLVDVAYYNSAIACALLEADPDCRGAAIIRDCEEFVRSATTLSGEDPMPAGWADPAKPLSPREKFIQMGRLKPKKGSAEHAAWPGWSGISRNIWLWQATNRLLIDAARRFPDRFPILDFARFQADGDGFVAGLASHFGIGPVPPQPGRETAQAVVNKKPFGYQVGPSTGWTADEQAQLDRARVDIRDRLQCQS